MAPPIKPAADKLPALKGRVMVDTFMGKVRLRKWPEKRGPRIPEQTRLQVTRFQEATKLTKMLKGSVFNRMIDAVKGTSLYPRDLAMKMMLNGPISFEADDGRIIQFGRPILEPCMFQGFILRLTANQGVAAGALHNITWPAPVLDTAGFFSAGSPTIITVPAGVTVMSFQGGWRRTIVDSGTQFASLVRVAPSGLTLVNGGGLGVSGPCFSTGALVVDEGETYALQAFSTNASTLLAERTFFSGTILQAN